MFRPVRVNRELAKSISRVWSAGVTSLRFILSYEGAFGPLVRGVVDIPEEVDIPEDVAPDGLAPGEAARGEANSEEIGRWHLVNTLV